MEVEGVPDLVERYVRSGMLASSMLHENSMWLKLIQLIRSRMVSAWATILGSGRADMHNSATILKHTEPHEPICRTAFVALASLLECTIKVDHQEKDPTTGTVVLKSTSYSNDAQAPLLVWIFNGPTDATLGDTCRQSHFDAILLSTNDRVS